MGGYFEFLKQFEDSSQGLISVQIIFEKKKVLVGSNIGTGKL